MGKRELAVDMNERVTITLADGIADVRLNRADKMNALDGAMMEGIIAAGQQLRDTAGLRAVVLSGEGRAFCAGLDMANFAGLLNADAASEAIPARLAPRTHGIANAPQYAAWVWRELPVPVIAVLRGVAFGGGFQIALGADMRYAAPDCRLSVMEIKWGLVPDMCGTQLMRHLARDDIVRELSYTGRVFSATEALQYGLVTRVEEDPFAAAMATAREIADRNPEAIRAKKRIFNQANYVSAEAGLLLESAEQDEIIGRPNQIEAVMAQLEKRRPNFVD